jgi:hypothetical protein
VENHNRLIHLFEQIHSFLQRMNGHTRVLLVSDPMEKLGKIMAQILFILALSTKAMTERRTSEFALYSSSFLADYGSEKFLKSLIGRTDVEDALLRLDSLTKEEGLLLTPGSPSLCSTVSSVAGEFVGDVGDEMQVIETFHQIVEEMRESTK